MPCQPAAGFGRRLQDGERPSVSRGSGTPVSRLSIRTHGWVGLDEKLDIVADMPVPPKWLAGNTLVSQAMRNQTISLPIKGTLNKPQIDPAELARSVSNSSAKRRAA